MEDCEFCEIVDRDEPARVICEDSTTVAFLPLTPATKGHSLVIPRTHVANFLQANEETFTDVMAMVARVSRAVNSVVRPDGMNLITSAGEAASQSVFHLHVHVVPRWRGDAVGEIWPPKRPALDVVQDSLAKHLREACAI